MILLKISAQNVHFLGDIRHWSELKIAKEGAHYWVKGLSEERLNTVMVQSIPFKEIFRMKEGMLFPDGANLPVSKAPSLLWSPIEKGIPVTLPDFNHNYFGIEQQVSIGLKRVENVEETTAMIIDLNDLEAFISSAPAIRLTNLSWIALEGRSALVIGAPVPSIKGKSYWIFSNAILPSGFHFEFAALASEIDDSLSSNGENWVLWNEDSSYIILPKSQFAPLSRSSFRLTSHFLPS